MARGKHSTALFEVIHSANKPDRIAQSLRTPKWWFKSRPKAVEPAPAPVPEYREQQTEEPVHQDVFEEIAQEPAPSRPRTSRIGRSSAVGFGFDRVRQELTLKLRYTTALVTGFAVFAIIGLSYVVGRHLGAGPKTAGATEQASVKELLQQPAQPGVFAVAKPKPTPRVTTSPPAGNSETVRRAPLATNVVAAKQDVTKSLVPPTADSSSPRKVGLNYLVIHSYPAERKAQAEAARDFFVKNGIPCSIEKTGWTFAGGLTLLGSAGFSKVSSADFASYVDSAAGVAKTYKSANFDQPKPTKFSVYSWRATDNEK